MGEPEGGVGDGVGEDDLGGDDGGFAGEVVGDLDDGNVERRDEEVWEGSGIESEKTMAHPLSSLPIPPRFLTWRS